MMARQSLLFPLFVVSVLAMACAKTPPPQAAPSVPPPRVVDLAAPDGTKLKATYFGAAEKGPGVLLFHQCDRQRKIWDDLAPRLASRGMHVMTLDFRGFGESGGPRNDQLAPGEAQRVVAEKWPGDVDAAFAYLLSQPGVVRDIVGAGGASCGVNQSVQLARRHPEVKSLVLLSGTTNRDGRQFLRQARDLPLFGSAADDDAGAVQIMEWLLALSPNPANTFQQYPTGGHGIEMFAPHPELSGLVLDWFDTTLRKTPGRAPANTATLRRTSVLGLLDEPGGIARGTDMLAKARQDDPKAASVYEGIINMLGYEHLASGDNKTAIDLLKINVAAYPNSPNAYDSLSDAYIADGQKELARQNAQKAIDLLPKSADPEARRKAIQQSAEQKLKQLEAGQK